MKSFDANAEALCAHYEPKRVVIAERFHFYKRDQAPGESQILTPLFGNWQICSGSQRHSSPTNGGRRYQCQVLRGCRARNSEIYLSATADGKSPHSLLPMWDARLTNRQTASSAVQYITLQFLAKATSVTRQYRFSVTVDSPSLSTVITVQNGNKQSSPNNQHGEADFAVWHHLIQATYSNFVVVSSDTDTWVYGLAINRTLFLTGKNVYVQRALLTVTSAFQEQHHSLLSNFSSCTDTCGIVHTVSHQQ